MTEYASLTARFGADTTGLAQGIRSADQQLTRAGRNIGRRMQSIGSSVTNVGVQFGILGGAATAAFGFAVNAAKDWESAFAGVIKTVDGTESQLADLETTLRGMATDSSNPLSGLENAHVTLAGIAESAGQLGVGIDDIAGFTQVIGELTLATDLTADSASTMIARFANISGMDLGGAGLREFADKLVALGNNSATTESQIMGMAMRLAGVNVNWGINEKETLAIAAAMSSVGIQAEAGGTSWTKFVNTLGAAASTHNEDLATFAEIAGDTQEVFAQKWETDQMGAITDFLEGFGALNPAQQIAALDELGLSGDRVADMLRRLSGEGGLDVLTSSLALEGMDATSREAQARLDTYEAHINTFKNKLNDLGIDIGNILLPALNDLLTAMGPVIDDFKDWATANPELIETIAAIGAGMAAVGVVAIPLGMIISALGTVFGLLAPVIGIVAGALGGVGLVAAAVAAVVVWAGVKWGIFKGILESPITTAIIDDIKWHIDQIVSAITIAIDAFKQLAALVSGGDIVLSSNATQSFSPAGELITEQSQTSVGLGPVGDFIGSVLGGNALGGPINGPALVGERGPELFAPPGSGGRIIPTDALGGYMGGGSGMMVIMHQPVFQGVEDAERLFDELQAVAGRRA